MTPSKILTIGQLAALTGVNLETIRYYETIALMPKPPRSAAGYRIYAAEHRLRLSMIRRARELGFSVDDIRGLIGLEEPRPCAEVEPLAAANLASVRAKIADLQRLETILDAAVRGCAGGRPQICPVIEILGGAGGQTGIGGLDPDGPRRR